ncbi:MAG: hypothetical protein J7K61_02120 [Thermoplasmata archaeon]|nr:hypothetical protein [Thermoplasmata archaeon]
MENKNLMVDALFLFYVIIVLPFVSFLYFAIAMTNLPELYALLGGAILWAVMIPYPVYKYVSMRFLYEK